MQKATVTYIAPFGDSKVVEMGGVTFFDGKSVEINSYDNPHLISKLQTNQHFDVVVGKEDDQPKPKAKRGRPSAADIAAAKADAEEKDRRAKIAADEAAAAKADLAAVKTEKAPLTPAEQQAKQVQPLPKVEPVT